MIFNIDNSAFKPSIKTDHLLLSLKVNIRCPDTHDNGLLKFYDPTEDNIAKYKFACNRLEQIIKLRLMVLLYALKHIQ